MSVYTRPLDGRTKWGARGETDGVVLQVCTQPSVEGEHSQRRLHVGTVRVLCAGAEVAGQHRLSRHEEHTKLTKQS